MAKTNYKTNKSYAKRLKVTRTGKILSRVAGQNHFNAKESRSTQMGQKGWVAFPLGKKELKKYLPNL